MKLFDVKAGDIACLPIYDNGMLAWSPSEAGVKYSVDGKVWGEAAYDPIRKETLRLVVWEEEPPAKLKAHYASQIEIKEEAREAFKVPVQYKYGITLANLEVSAVKEPPPPLKEPESEEPKPKRVRISECQIGDQVRIGILKSGSVSDSPDASNKSIVGFVVGRRSGSGIDTYIAWENPNIDWTSLPLDEQSILPERRTQYKIDPKFRYGRHFPEYYQVDVIKAAAPNQEPKATEKKVMKLSEISSGTQVKIGINQYQALDWAPSSDPEMNITATLFKKEGRSFIAWKKNSPIYPMGSELPILENERIQYGMDDSFKYGTEIADVKAEVISTPTEVKVPVKSNAVPLKLSEFKSGDKVKVGLDAYDCIAWAPTSDKNIVGTIFRSENGNCHLAWTKEEEPSPLSKHYGATLSSSANKVANIPNQYIYVLPISPRVEAELVEAAKPEEVANLEPIKTMKLKEVKKGDQIKLGVDERGNIIMGLDRAKFLNATLVVEGLRPRIAWKTNPKDTTLNSIFVRPITEEEYTNHSIARDFEFSVELNPEVEVEVVLKAPQPKMLESTKTGDLVRVPLSRAGYLLSLFKGSDKSVETTVFRTRGGQCFLLWEEEPSIIVSDARKITELEYGDFDIDRRYTHGFVAGGSVEFEMIQAAPTQQQGYYQQGEQQVVEAPKEAETAVIETSCACDHCGLILPRHNIYIEDNPFFDMVWCKDCINEERGRALPREWQHLTPEDYERTGFVGETFTPDCFDRLQSIPKKAPSLVGTFEEPTKASYNPVAIAFKDANLKVGDTIKIPLSEVGILTMDFNSSGKSVIATILHFNDSYAYVAWKDDKSKTSMGAQQMLINKGQRSTFNIAKSWKYGSTISPMVKIEVIKRKAARKKTSTMPLGFMLAAAGAGLALSGLSTGLPSTTSTNKEKTTNEITM